MGRSGAVERERLFTHYSRQLDQFGVDPPGLFVCPRCLRGFSRVALDGPNPSVSLAHVVPEALGGRLCTLTCTPCNNGNGTRIEAALCDKLRYDDWCVGVGTRPARLTSDFGEVGVEFRRSPDTSNWAMYLVDKQSHPANVAAFESWGAATGGRAPDGAELNIRWFAPDRPGDVAAAIRQSAFLLMFAYFGYGFALDRRYAPLREHILNPPAEVSPTAFVTFDPGVLGRETGVREGAVMFVHEPAPYVLAFLRFQPTGGTERVIGVPLPAPDADAPPDVAVGSVRGDIVPYRPEELATVPRRLGRLWRWTRGRPRE